MTTITRALVVVLFALLMACDSAELPEEQTQGPNPTLPAPSGAPVPTVNLARAFSDIANELRTFYSLGYYPKAELQPGERRKIKVSVKRDGVSVQARGFYVVGDKDKK